MATPNTQSGPIDNYVTPAPDVVAQSASPPAVAPRRDKIVPMTRVIVTLGALTLADIAVLLGAAYGGRYAVAVVALVVYCALTLAWGVAGGYFIWLTAQNWLAYFRMGKKASDSVPNAQRQ